MVHKFGKTSKVVFGMGIHKAGLEKAIANTKIAYADSIGYPEFAPLDSPEVKAWEEKAYKTRKLDWTGTPYMTPEQWHQVAKIVGQYNEFDPNKVYLALKQFKGIQVKMARESSPSIYIKYGSNDPKKIEKVMTKFANADEVHIDYVMGKYDRKYKYHPITQKKGFMRIWWD